MIEPRTRWVVLFRPPRPEYRNDSDRKRAEYAIEDAARIADGLLQRTLKRLESVTSLAFPTVQVCMYPCPKARVSLGGKRP